MEPAQAAIKTANTAKLEAVIEHVKLSAERYRQGFLAGCDAARVVDELIRDMGFGQGLRVFVRMWETTSAEALNTEMWWDWYTAECETRGLLGGATLWSHSTLNGWLQIVRFMDAHADEDDQDGQAVRGATSQEEALKAIRKYNQQQKEVRSKQAAEQRSSLGKRDRTRKGPTLMEEQAATVAPKRPRRRKAPAGGRGRGAGRSSGGGRGGAGPSCSAGDGDSDIDGHDGGASGAGGADNSDHGGNSSDVDEAGDAGGAGGGAHRPPRGDSTQVVMVRRAAMHKLIDELPPYVQNKMTGKGRTGDDMARVLDALRAMKRATVPSSSPVVPTSPSPSTMLPAPSPRRTRHTSASAASSSSSACASEERVQQFDAFRRGLVDAGLWDQFELWRRTLHADLLRVKEQLGLSEMLVIKLEDELEASKKRVAELEEDDWRISWPQGQSVSVARSRDVPGLLSEQELYRVERNEMDGLYRQLFFRVRDARTVSDLRKLQRDIRTDEFQPSSRNRPVRGPRIW